MEVQIQLLCLLFKPCWPGIKTHIGLSCSPEFPKNTDSVWCKCKIFKSRGLAGQKTFGLCRDWRRLNSGDDFNEKKKANRGTPNWESLHVCEGWRGHGDMGCVYVPSRGWKKESLLNSKLLFIFDIALLQSVINLLFCLIIVEMFSKRFKKQKESLKRQNSSVVELKGALSTLQQQHM